MRDVGRLTGLLPSDDAVQNELAERGMKLDIKEVHGIGQLTAVSVGFLNTKQFLWQGCDSLLAAPLLLDIVFLTLLAQRRGEVGILKHLACFLKSPMGCGEHDFFKQMEMIAEYTRMVRA